MALNMVSEGFEKPLSVELWAPTYDWYVIPITIRNSFFHPYFSFFKKQSPVEDFWLVVSTHLKNISQIGSFPQGLGWK